MDVTSIAAAASANAAAKVQAEVSIRVLKMAMNMQEESALQLVQALPEVVATSPAYGRAAGGLVDTWA
ncbi:hypothetical protein CGK74_06450 [Thauera propionica]|uniref:Motility protein n=1 Tax=Thauera propionica TaxID=2019431 RepID=A0A235EZH0_9RHOO|nr:YjfB family protein [Thauera propionica]OYD54439.1 hypothetical protein CGK74_06450 [Thauera propionica]